MSFLNPEEIDPSQYDIEVMSVSGTGYRYFPITPQHYIQRTKELYNQYHESDEVGKKLILTDCLSNCKKAIDYIMDNILSFFGLLEDRMAPGVKFELFRIMNLIPLHTLDELRNARNMMEHEHYIPNQVDASRYLEICEFFYRVFNRFHETLGYQFLFENDIEKFEIEYDINNYCFLFKVPTGKLIGYSKGGFLRELMDLEPIPIVEIKVYEIHRPKTGNIKKYAEEDNNYVKWCGFLLKIQM